MDRFGVSIKGVLELDGKVLLRKNERLEYDRLCSDRAFEAVVRGDLLHRQRDHQPPGAVHHHPEPGHEYPGIAPISAGRRHSDRRPGYGK